MSSVTTGAQQALDLIGKIFIDPGDLIAVEAPAYVGALTAFGTYEPRYLPIELDDDGMLVEQLEQALRARRAAEVRLHRARTSAIPSGVTMSYARREHLVALCREASIPIIEDNPYGLLRFEGEASPVSANPRPGQRHLPRHGVQDLLAGCAGRVGAGRAVGRATADPGEGGRRSLRFESEHASDGALVLRREPLADNAGQPRRYVSVAPRRHAGGARGALPGGVDLDTPARRVLRLGHPAGMARREGARLPRRSSGASPTCRAPRSIRMAGARTSCGSRSATRPKTASARASLASARSSMRKRSSTGACRDERTTDRGDRGRANARARRIASRWASCDDGTQRPRSRRVAPRPRRRETGRGAPCASAGSVLARLARQGR